MQQIDVVIAGGGPVGLTLAALLAAQGIASTVIEADEGYCTGSRAICLARRSLEILDWCGAADAVLSKGLPWTSGRSYFRDAEVLKFDMPHDATQRFAPMTNIQQFYVEQYVLEAANKSYPGKVNMLWNTRLEGLVRDAKDAQSTQGVRLQVSNAQGQQEMFAKWVIACDGGRSTVRDLLGLQLKGVQYEGRYVIVDVKQKSTRLQTQPVERLAWFDPPTNPGSTILMHRQPDDVWRIDYQVRDDEDPVEAVKPENVLPRVKAHLEWMGEIEPWEPLWISIYNAKCLTLDEYRHGRVLLAGDAAHMVPIFGVRGLNSGIDDVGNLAWKLAAVLQQRAGAALLNTYSAERRAAALINIAYGSKSTEFMSPPHHGFDIMRQAALRLAGSTPAVRSLINPRQSAPVRYPTYEGTGEHSHLPTAGMVAPEARIVLQEKVQFLSQCFGKGYTLLCFGELIEVTGLQALLMDAVVDIHGEVQARYNAAASSHTAVLIRPDGYVAARWERPTSAQVSAALRKEMHDANE